jgi:hypothetical protein
MTRTEERKRERAFAIEYLARLKIGLIETVAAEGDGPLADSVRKTMARLMRRIAVLDALLAREQARANRGSQQQIPEPAPAALSQPHGPAS